MEGQVDGWGQVDQILEVGTRRKKMFSRLVVNGMLFSTCLQDRENDGTP